MMALITNPLQTLELNLQIALDVPIQDLGKLCAQSKD